MPTIVLKKHANPQQISDADLFNTIKPLEYYEWIKHHVAIIPEQAETQYQKYLVEWYSRKNNQIHDTPSSKDIKDDYIALLKKLKIIFKNDEEFDRLTNINFDSATELKLAIPYFAKKLKEIALYYVNQRDKIKNAKLKYNMSGSYHAVERILYEHLLQAFSKKEYSYTIQANDVFSSIPELSAIKNDFQIEIEELYDMADYFDKNYTEQKNSTGNYDLSSNNPLLFVLEDYIANIYNAVDATEVPLSALSNPLEFVMCEAASGTMNEQILASLGGKYLGNNIFYLTGGFYEWDRINVNLDLVQGNNFFYWFSGENLWEAPEGIYLDTPLSSIDWSTQGTGGSSFDVSDIIFKSVGNKIVEGAWLMDTEYITIVRNMSATMTEGKTFKFPYPGIGTSAEGGDWTGKFIYDVVEQDRKFFPSEKSFQETQKQIEKLYWNETDSISSAQEIYLQDSTLARSGAFASRSYQKADKIIVRRNTGTNGLNDANPNGVFTGELETSWLFDFNRTEIPIKKGNNNIYYPLTSFENSNELFFRYESGDDIPLSSINVGSAFAGAIAGNVLNDADILIKLNSVCGPEIEAAWLKGIPLSSYQLDELSKCNCDSDYIDYYTKWKFKDGVTQPSVSFKVDFGNFVRFVWTGKRTNINDIKAFTGFEHDASCEYHQQKDLTSLLDTNFLSQRNKSNYETWKKCTCKAVHFSPMGHKGNNFLDYKYFTDFIIKDTRFPDSFSFKDWRGSDNKDYKTSKDRAWFKLSNSLEPDVGWGKGEWQSEEGFFLEPGETYIYYRSNLNRCGFELPYFVMNLGYCECGLVNCADDNCIPQWRKAVLNNNGEWEDAGVITDMVLESGSFFTYIHKENNIFSKSILTYGGFPVSSTSSYITLSSIDPNVGERVETVVYPSNDFLIKIPLVNSQPYWGKADFSNNSYTKEKRNMVGKKDSNIVFEYLQIVQPTPSNTILHNNDTIEYVPSECSNGCFIWDQPVKFTIINPIRRWNKILIDNCIESDILNYLYEESCSPCRVADDGCKSKCPDDNICGCENLCKPNKVGVTATNIPSDMVLNTETSGIPVFVNYYARNPFVFNFEVIDITNGIPPHGGLWVPPVSTVFSEAEIPWLNIINDRYPLVANETSDELFNRKELGLFTPQRLATGKYELKDGKFRIAYEFRNKNSYDLIREETYADGDIRIEETYSSWMKKKQGQMLSGNIKIDKHQTFYPYTNTFEMIGKENFGLATNDPTVPWDDQGIWNSEDNFPPNERGLYPINCGDNSFFSTQITLSANIIEWQTDIYGNQYFLLNDENTRLNSDKFNIFYIKTQNGLIYTATDMLSAIFDKYRNIDIN